MAFSNNSIKFDGIDGYADAEYSTLLNFDRTNAFSISCWVKTKATNSINTIISKMDGVSGTGYRLSMNASGQYEFILRNTAATDSLRVRTVADGYNEGGWHHLVVTYDGGGNVLVYIDGLVKVTTTVYNTLSSSITNTAPFQIGAYDGSNAFDGSIDEVAIFTTVVPPETVLEMFGSAKPSNLAINAYSPLTYSSEYDGTIEHIDFSWNGATRYQPNESFSLAIWFKTYLPPDNSTEALMSQWIWSAGPGSLGWFFARQDDGDIRFFMAKQDGVYFYKRTENVNWSDGMWHFCVVTYDGSGDENGLSIYMDGAEITDVSSGSSGIVDTIDYATYGTRLRVGQTHSSGNAYRGRLLHSAAIGRVLSSAEVADLYSSGRPRDLTDVVDTADIDHWCTLGDGCTTGSSACPDLSPNSAHGTAQYMEVSDFTIEDLPPTPMFTYSPLTQSLLLDGVDEYVTYAEDTGNQLVKTEPFTISIWFKVVTDQTGFLIGRYHNPAGPGATRGWRIIYVAGGSLRFSITVSSDTGTGIVTRSWTLGSAGVNDGAWHQWTVTYNGNDVSTEVNSCLDGVYKFEANHTITLGDIRYQPMAHPGEPLQIGRGDDGLGGYDYFSGNVAHAAIYKGIEMDRWEMVLLYAAGNPQSLNQQIRNNYLSFWDTLGDGDAIGAGNMIDLSTYGNNGEAVNCESGDFEADVPTGRDLSGMADATLLFLDAWWRMGDGDTYPVLIDQMIGDYQFPNARDLSGNDYDGTATNMEAADAVRDVPRTGFCKYSVLFDGSTNYITMGNVLGFERTDPFSVSFWFKRSATTTGTVVSKLQSFGPRGWWVYISATSVVFELVNDGGALVLARGYTTGFDPNDGDWHHVVVTWDGDASPGVAGINFYIDGVLSAKGSNSDTLGSNTILNTGSFEIGHAPWGDFFDGNITEVGIYYTELSASHAQWIYNGGLPQALDGYGAPPNLVAWWRVGTIDQADEQARDLVWGASPETSQINDMSRFTNHATATNTEAGDFTVDTPGGEAQYSVDLNDHIYSLKSIDFDGSDDYVTMGNSYVFKRDEEFSVSFWIKTTDIGAPAVVVMGNLDLTPEYEGWEIYIDSSGYLVIQLIHDATGGDYLQVRNTSTTWRDNTWRHWCVTYDGSSDASGVTMYLDGSSVATNVNFNNLTDSIATTGDFGLGARISEGSSYLEASLDEVAIYDRELLASDVTAIYNSGDPLDLSALGESAGNLAGWWRMGEGDSYPALYNNGLVPQPFVFPRVFDMSGNSNHGTMTNMETDDSVADFPRSAFTKYSVDFGSGEYVTMGNESELDFDSTHVFSLSCWFKTTMSGDGTLISKMEASPYKGYLLYVRTGGKIAFRLINTWNTNLIDVETTTTWNDGEWHHVALVYNGSESAAGVTIYIDGASESLNTIFDTLSATTLNTATFRLAYRHSNDYPYVGKMADAVVYNIGLSEADASWMYNDGIPLDLRDGYDDGDGYNDGYIVGYWRPGNGYDELGYVKKIQDWVWGDVSTKETTTITDASFLPNNLTLNNMTADDVSPETPGGISNYSCYFNGVNAFAFTSSRKVDYGIENGDVLSLSGWVKTTSSGDPVYLWGNAYATTAKAGYHVFLSSGKPTFEMAANDLSTTKFIIQTTSATVNDGYWHHIVFAERWISTNNYDVACYIDGVSVGLTTLNNGLGGSSISTGEGFSIGGRGSTGLDPVDGYIDEVSAYRKMLTQSDVDDIYNSGAPVDLRDLSSALHMMGWWRMGDSYGIAGTAVNTEAVDKNGDAPGAVVYSSKSLRFDVTNEYVNMGNPPELSFDVDDPFSISVWVKNTRISSYEGVVGKSDGLPYRTGWWLQVYNNNLNFQASSLLQFTISGIAGLIEVYMGDRRGAFPYNEWVNVVVTYDGTNDGSGIKFYLNGELYPTYIRYNTSNTTIINSSNFTAGLASGSYNIGNMDELSVWNKELSQADVTAIWNGGDPSNLSLHTSAANLAGWWRMTDGTGPIDGTMTNMSPDDINGDIPVASPEHLITASGDSIADFGATYNYKWTIGTWLKTDNEFGVIVNKNYNADFSGWGMRLLGGYPTIWWANTPTTLLTEQRSDVRVDDGYWHHVVAIRDRVFPSVPDLSGNYDGMMINMEYGDITTDSPGGISQYSTTFDGVDEYITMGNVLAFERTDSFSVSFWIKYTVLDQWILGNTASAPPYGWAIGINSVGHIKFQMVNTWTTNWMQVRTAGNFNDGSWHHVVVTHDGTFGTGGKAGGCRIYVDNVNQSLTANADILTATIVSTGDLALGALVNPSLYFQGSLDEVSIYSDVLSAGEVAWIYNTSDPRDLLDGGAPDNLEAWWRMGDALLCKFYVDGALTDTVLIQNTNADNAINNSGTLAIGLAKGSGEGEQPFIGKISEVAVWNGDFSSIEVAEAYNGGSPPNLINLSTEERLRGWWRCGDDSGNPGTYTNFATARLGDVPGEEYSTESFDLDGTNEYVAIDSGIAYERTDAFSVSCWFKAQTRNEWPMSQMSTYGWYLDELDNTPYWRMEGATGAIRIYFGYEDIISENTWYHMVVTYDGSSTAAGTKMYINGEEIPAIYVDLDTLAGSIAGGTINLGNREGTYFDGQVDEASIWSKELSAAEVDEIYNDGVPNNVSKHSAVENLDGWWKLGETNGNDVTMINMLSGDIVLNAPREAGAIGEQIDYFLMKGIDTACGTLTYHYWLVTETPDFAGTYAGTLPCGGPLTDIVVASSWSVIN